MRGCHRTSVLNGRDKVYPAVCLARDSSPDGRPTHRRGLAGQIRDDRTRGLIRDHALFTRSRNRKLLTCAYAVTFEKIWLCHLVMPRDEQRLRPHGRGWQG